MNEEEVNKITLNLAKKQLKKVPKQDDAQNIRILILDENDLQKIDNIDSYLKIEKLSLGKNQLLRMYGVCRLHSLRELNLSFNGILSIEGLKDCIHLRHLNLEGNNIKTIEHLNNNVKLEYLNLAENSIGSVSDISYLKCLKELYLHSNRLTHLRQCDKYLPISLEVLTLSKNKINDLNEICTLSNLGRLYSITINDNPCVSMTCAADGFDHRPFVLNWCMSVKVIDGFVVDPIESLKAEWLYSQGRGRQFRLGEQSSLAKYLSSVCPLIGKALENENERKLRLILSKAQQHQRQLQEEISENSNTSCNNSPSSGRKKPASRIQSPRFSRLSGRQGSPESMISSYHGNTSIEQVSNANHLIQMTTSLIENIKNDSQLTTCDASNSSINSSVATKTSNSQETTPRTMTPNPYNEQSFINPPTGGPLAAASKMVPVPETLMSPDVCPSTMAQRMTVSALNTQLQNAKTNKNKDNKLNSPKNRSPHMKRKSVMSPRKINSNSNSMTVIQKISITNNLSNLSKTQIESQIANANNQATKSRLVNNSGNAPVIETCTISVASSDDEYDDINVDKLKTIRNKAAAQRYQQQQMLQTTPTNMLTIARSKDSYATIIQKIWRGYQTRKKTKYIAEILLRKRTREYIEQLTKDMALTKAQLENERKIQQLHMQAINALWKKVSTMQQNGGVVQLKSNENVSSADSTATTSVVSNEPEAFKTLSLDNSSTTVVSDLTKTCTMLTNQVQQLQGSMRDILNCMSLFCNIPQENVKKLLASGLADALANEMRDTAATQTEIVAVHTPQIENHSNFPFTKVRPSTLPLDSQKVAGKQLALNQQKIDEEVQDENPEILNESGIASSVSAYSNELELMTEKTDDEKEQKSEIR